MKWRLGGWLGCALICGASTALAQPTQAQHPSHGASPVRPAPQESEAATTPSLRWYGWQALPGDVVAAGLGLTALALSEEADKSARATLVLTTAGVYSVGAPVVHLLHRRPGVALGSFVLRLVLPLMGTGLASSTVSCPDPHSDEEASQTASCRRGPLLIGAAVGTVLAMAFDDGLIAWEPHRSRARPPEARLWLTPIISADGRRELLLSGSF